MLSCYVISNLEITGILEDFVRCYDPLQKTRMGYDEKDCYYTRHFETAFTEKTALWKILLSDDQIIFEIDGNL